MPWKKITADAEIIPVDFQRGIRLPKGTEPPKLRDQTLPARPDRNIPLVDYLHEYNPLCDDCEHPFTLHGDDDGSCTFGRGPRNAYDACPCYDFINEGFDDWYSSR